MARHQAVTGEALRQHSKVEALWRLDLAAQILWSCSVSLAVKVAAEAEDLSSIGGGMIQPAWELFLVRNTWRCLSL
jgi:hypothetical protein